MLLSRTAIPAEEQAHTVESIILPVPPLTSLSTRLCKETGVTEAQALDLIGVLGPNWSSLMREAKYLMHNRL